ncbi:MAG: ABC transporter permease [Sterolibacterium sp.]|nr:ABC transporter permease [Sterolibacterium sp.]
MDALNAALGLVVGGDARLLGIIALSLRVSLSAVLLASLFALPFGALMAVRRFPGRRSLTVIINGFMGLPAVVVGLLVYLLLSRAGPLGPLGLLFTPTAMVIAQAMLVTPLLVALTRQIIADAWREYEELLHSLGASAFQATATLLWDARYSLFTVLLAGFGRAIAEVGAVMIVGGNIDGVTRVMTTAIALETTKGDLPLAMALGVILVALVLIINAFTFVTSSWAQRRFG